MRTGPTPPPPHRPEQGQRTDTDRLLRIDDSTALVMVIVNKVASKDELLGEAWTLDGEKASNSPLAYAKAAVDISMETPHGIGGCKHRLIDTMTGRNPRSFYRSSVASDALLLST